MEINASAKEELCEDVVRLLYNAVEDGEVRSKPMVPHKEKIVCQLDLALTAQPVVACVTYWLLSSSTLPLAFAQKELGQQASGLLREVSGPWGRTFFHEL